MRSIIHKIIIGKIPGLLITKCKNLFDSKDVKSALILK